MKPFLQGKKTLDAEPLRLPQAAALALAPRCGKPAAPNGAAPANAQGAHVEVVKEGDKVVRLIVHCVCGERVEIECLYSAGR